MTSSNTVNGHWSFKDKNGNNVEVGDTIRLLPGNPELLSEFEADVNRINLTLGLSVIIPKGVIFEDTLDDASCISWWILPESSDYIELVNYSALSEPSEDIYNDLI